MAATRTGCLEPEIGARDLAVHRVAAKSRHNLSLMEGQPGKDFAIADHDESKLFAEKGAGAPGSLATCFDIFSDDDLDKSMGTAMEELDHAEGDVAAGGLGTHFSVTRVRPAKLAIGSGCVAVQTEITFSDHDASCQVTQGPIAATLLSL